MMKFMDMLASAYEYFAIILGVSMALLSFAAGIVVVRRRLKGRSTHIEPVGINRDLPDSVTGMNNYKKEFRQ